MARIYGVQMKAIKQWEARDGIGTSANIYIDNKKVGTFYDAGDGGCVDINIDTAEARQKLEERTKKYFENFPFDKTGIEKKGFTGDFDKKYSFLTNSEAFLEEVYNLQNNENFFKKNVKKGFKMLVVFDYPFFAEGPHPYLPATMYGGKDPLATITKFVKEKKKQFPYLKTKTYGALEDFNID